MTAPLRNRVCIPERLHFYTHGELDQVITRAARLLALPIASDGALEIAKRSRGTPRIAGRLLRRVRDFAPVAGPAIVDAKAADAALNRLEDDALGLDARSDDARVGEHGVSPCSPRTTPTQKNKK